jgi:hypothetical protein
VGLEETLKAVNPSEDVVVSESTGLQLLSDFDKVSPEENEVEVPVTSSFGDNMKQSVANSNDPIPFFMRENPAILVGTSLLNNSVSLSSDVGGNVDNICSVSGHCQPNNTGVKNNPQNRSNRKSSTKLPGRSSGRAPGNNQGGRGRTTFRSVRVPTIPPALSANIGWSMVNVPATTDVLISDQKVYLDYKLTPRIIGFVDGVRHKLYDKLEANHLEASPKNIFLLLAQPGIDKLLEYTSESMNRSGA